MKIDTELTKLLIATLAVVTFIAPMTTSAVNNPTNNVDKKIESKKSKSNRSTTAPKSDLTEPPSIENK